MEKMLLEERNIRGLKPNRNLLKIRKKLKINNDNNKEKLFTYY